MGIPSPTLSNLPPPVHFPPPLLPGSHPPVPRHEVGNEKVVDCAYLIIGHDPSGFVTGTPSYMGE